MKKNLHITGFSAVFLSAFVMISVSSPRGLNAGSSAHHRWGMKINALEKDLSARQIRLRRFVPQERPRYKNKIMTYILSVDPTVESKMVILRHRKKIVRDYLFVNRRLYSVLDDMGNVSQGEVNATERRLRARFGRASVDKKKYLTIRSYKNDTTKVLFYSKLVQDGKYRCKVYFYASSIFRMLLMDN